MKWFVGTYSKRNSDGIYLIDFDESNGKFDLINSLILFIPLKKGYLLDNPFLTFNL